MYAQSHAVHWTQEYDQVEGLYTRIKGPSIKYICTSRSRGRRSDREGVTVCNRGLSEGGGQEHVTSRLYKFLSYI